tara:strand:+ start:347 stop:973 length:627 start_codon:yes stop_codon:yes gene_type:complete
MTFSNKVTWKVDPDRCALLIHDMQPHYLAAIPADRRGPIVQNVRAIGTTCVDRGIPIFASQVPAQGGRERGLMLDMWGSGPTADSYGLDPDLGLGGREVRLLTKRSYSAFYGNDFEILLRRLGRDAILIVGVYTSIGCYCSAVDAFMRDIRPFLIADASADMNDGDHAKGLETAARLCARVVDTATIIAALDRTTASLPDRPIGIDVC